MDLKWIVAAFAALAGLALSFFLQPPSVRPADVLIAQGVGNQVSIAHLSAGFRTQIPTGPVTHGVGALPDGSKAYAASYASDEVWVIDLISKENTKRIDIGGKSHHVEISPDGRWVYVTVGSTNSVAVIDTRSGTLAASIPVGEGPTYTAFSPDSAYAYVSNMQAGTVSMIDTDAQTVQSTIQVGAMPDHLAMAPDGKTLYVTLQGDNRLAAVDTSEQTLAWTVPVGQGPHGVAVVERKGAPLVAVGNRGETTLSLVNPATQQVVDTVDLGASPEHLIAGSDRRLLYVGSMESRILYTYDIVRQRIVSRFPVGGEIHQIALMGSLAHAPFRNTAGYFDVKPAQLAVTMEREDVTLINVHTPHEGELPETDLFLPFNRIAESADRLPQNRAARLVVYCRSGSMSATAAKALVDLGYTDVWNLQGGMIAWEEAGYELLQRP